MNKLISQMWSWSKLGTLISVVAVLAVVSLLCFWIWFEMWVTNIENYELGFVFDKVTGKIELTEKQGWVIRTPIRYGVHHIDLRPHQLTISANQRVLNAKLVRFDPKGLETFVEWHGRSAGDNTYSLQEILKCYAFDTADGKDCPFLKVVQEIAPNQGAQVPHNVKVEDGKVGK